MFEPTAPREAPIHPLALRLSGKAVLCVGAGAVSERRVNQLLEAGAQITVIAPAAVPGIEELADAGGLTWLRRGYVPGDLEGMWLAHTATGDRELDARVSADAEGLRIWCVNASDHAASSAWTPAVARTEEGITVAVTAGGDPRRAAGLRNAIALAADTGLLPLRRRRAGSGSVALVGGGPGDPGLITVTGRRLLAAADVVVADRLGPRDLLKELDPSVRIIEVGKAPGDHLASQDEINAVLVREARTGNRVVRLKGGDPFVLGRGGEEAAHCRENGVAVEVVPGVTSAVSVPAAAGIPVTHRGVAAGFSMATGHDELTELPARPDHTLVLLMGVARLGRNTATLLGRGLPADTPVAVIERGWTPDQRVTIDRLDSIAAAAEAIGVANPAVVVIGDVVRLSPHAAGRLAPAVPAPGRQPLPVA
ncbi:uroporphyrinogen-III C-methyltransferase [Paeniglutamicibacter sp. ORCA_105]|uniref:uroporphyrinogen-III C-methyltransferase n=1 Tax=Paeniglutamicibacter sp. ORCA_105 TaxID=3377336 RepID=UPI0038966B55